MSPEALECHAALAAAAARLRAAHRALAATRGVGDGEARRRVCAELRAAEEEYLCLRVVLLDL